MNQKLLLLLAAPILLSAVYCRPVFAQDLKQIEAQARAGDKESQYRVAIKRYNTPASANVHSEAVYWFKKAAEQDFPEAAYCLAHMYEEGKGTKKDPYKAKEWYEKAAKSGHAKAQYHLGLMLYEGYGIQKDTKTALYWLQQAAEQNVSKAQYRLGYAYSEGKGFPKNKPLAIKWLTKASENGEEEAKILLSLINRQG